MRYFNNGLNEKFILRNSFNPIFSLKKKEQLYLFLFGKNYYKFVSCGSVLKNHEIRIVGNNQLVAEQMLGSIQFKGLSAMEGYYLNNQETQAAFHQGF